MKKLLLGEELFGLLNVVPLCVLILKVPKGDRRMDVSTGAELFSSSPSPETYLSYVGG
jgi:hypothetical protein